MAFKYELQIENAGSLARGLRNFVDDQDRELERRVAGAGFVYLSAIKQHAAGKTIGGTEDTGKLAQSWTMIRERTATNEPIARVGSNSPYAAIHQFGGTIFPDEAKALTVPLDKQAARSTAGDHDLVAIYFDNSSNPYIIGALAEPGPDGPFRYLLMTQVEIPERPYISNAIKDAKPTADKILDGAATASLGRLR